MRRRTINLALQGGGALGALTWGVLDRLLEEPWLSIEGISGTSAGAMNAVALAHGLTIGGRDGAREALESFWLAVGNTSYAVQIPYAGIPPAGAAASPTTFLLGLTRSFSPYQLNPLNFNPLRAIVERQFDFERIRRECPIKLFVGVTQVRSGTLRIFLTHELTAQHLLASACLPALSQAVQIDGENYWDGAYAGNPPLYPLVYECRAPDIVVVMLQPLSRQATPTAAQAIRSRVTEIHFNATFLREMRGLWLARRQARRSLLSFGRLERRLRALNFHLIDTNELVGSMAMEKSLNVSLAFLLRLKQEGRERADRWLRERAGMIGRESSTDIAELFL